MFSFVSNPELKMPILKGRAAEIKSLGPALLETFREFSGIAHAVVPLVQQQQIEMALRASVGMDDILAQHKGEIKFDDDVYNDFYNNGFMYLMLFNSLAMYYSEAAVPAKKLFDLTIKGHELAHCILEARWLNPALGWCYAGEDFMFRFRRLMQRCVHNNRPSAAANAFVTKYCVGLHLLHTM